MKNGTDRRNILKGLFALPAFVVLGSKAEWGTAEGNPLANALGTDLAGRVEGSPAGRALVMVHLAGGNDGLNTVVPIGDPAYARLRPALALSKADVLPIDRGLALHPALGGFKTLYERGQLAIVQGVGYPNPDFSHFRATEIWEAGDPNGGSSGWIGRYLDETPARRGLRAVALSKEQPPLVLASSSSPAVTVSDTASFRPPANADAIRAMYAAYAKQPAARHVVGEAGVETLNAASTISSLRGGSGVNYPPGELSADLRRAAELLAAGVGIEVLHLSFGGFDTHVNQTGKHRQLLNQLGGAFAAFQQDLERRGIAKNVATVVYSEFGRRPAENFGGGTDHGSAGPLFVIANGVRGGLHGEAPSLTALDNGNLRFTTDFRAVFGGIVRDCLKGDPSAVFRGIAPLGLF